VIFKRKKLASSTQPQGKPTDVENEAETIRNEISMIGPQWHRAVEENAEENYQDWPAGCFVRIWSPQNPPEWVKENLPPLWRNNSLCMIKTDTDLWSTILCDSAGKALQESTIVGPPSSMRRILIGYLEAVHGASEFYRRVIVEFSGENPHGDLVFTTMLEARDWEGLYPVTVREIDRFLQDLSHYGEKPRSAPYFVDITINDQALRKNLLINTGHVKAVTVERKHSVEVGE
jgi:hypothetical protein